MLPIPIIIINKLASVRPHCTVKVSLCELMTMTFANESDVIIYALKRIVSFARENQYLFVANCAWWIAEVIELDSDLTIHIDNSETRMHLEQIETSTIRRDIARSMSEDSDQSKIEEELLPASSLGSTNFLGNRGRN
jgi:hypothetical protein